MTESTPPPATTLRARDTDSAAAVLRAEAIRHGNGMVRRFGLLVYLLGLIRMTSRIRLEDHSAERIRAAAAQGPIVYVLGRRSLLDYLALTAVLVRRRLPLALWVNGVSTRWAEPLGEAWRHTWDNVRARFSGGPVPDAVRSGWLADAVAHGLPLAVFLEPRIPGLSLPDEDDPLVSLLAAQRRCERSIRLVPVVVLWNRAPELRAPEVARWLLGGVEGPGLIGRLRRWLMPDPSTFVQVGEPIDLAGLTWRLEAVRTRAKKGDSVAVRVRHLLRRALRNENGTVRGPRLLPHSVVRRMVLDNPPMRELARREAMASGTTEAKVQRRMARDFDRIAARFEWWIIRLLHVVLDPLWTRVYAGVDARPEDMDRIRTAMRNGTAVLVPCHKSHFDYLLLSWVLYEHDMTVPHVVAGMNLAIWPVSYFLRGAGAFFVLRSFGDDRVFPAVFARYLRELIRQGWPIEFFIEGGRSRNGRLLPPKLGVLSNVLEGAEHRAHGREVTLLPISLAYENVAEEQSYARELAGAKKRPESLGQLVAARSVLRRRYGRVYLRVGEPVLASTVLADGGWSELDRAERGRRLDAVAHRLLTRIGEVTVVLPTALVAAALLAHHRRGIKHSELLARIERFRALLSARGALLAPTLDDASAPHAIALTLQKLSTPRRGRALVDAATVDGEPVWAPVPDQRVALEFHKNQILHLFAPAAFAAAALRGAHGPASVDALLPGFTRLAHLLRWELLPDPDRSPEVRLRDGLTELVTLGAIQEEGGQYRVVAPDLAGEVHGLLRPLLESLLVPLRASLGGRTGDVASVARHLQADGSQLVTNGWITRPEALSHAALAGAIKVWVAEKVLVVEPDSRWKVDAPAATAALAALEAMVDR